MEPTRWSATEPHLVPVRIAALGLSQAVLGQAVDDGLSRATSCTAHHPINYPGMVVWGEAVASLRDQLAPGGWEPSNVNGLPTVVHPSRSHQIAVAGGTADTGRHDGIPRTRHPKGLVAELAIADNQISLDPTGDIIGGPFAERAPQTWYLLHYADPITNEVRIELSLPGQMRKGQITGWIDRLILDPLPGTRDVPIEPAPEVPIAIDITRRETS